MKSLFMVLVVLFMFSTPAFATDTMDITLQWDANSEADLAGYKVYWDIDSGHPYASSFQMTLADDENPDDDIVEYTVLGLPYGTMHFFAVTAYDTENLESGYSNEINTDGLTSLPPAPPDGLGYIQITIHRADGTTVIVEVP